MVALRRIFKARARSKGSLVAQSLYQGRAGALAAALDVLIKDEKPLAEVCRDYVLKDDSDWVLSGKRFPLTQNCLHALARLLQPRSYLEIGTRYGYSLGAVVSGSCRLEIAVTVDIENRVSQIIENIRTIREVPRLEVICASSEDFDTDELFDFVYVDGDHTYEVALHDLRKFWKNVGPGGFMFVDDTTNYRWDETFYTESEMGVLRAVKTLIAETNDIESIVLQYPTYSGLCILVKHICDRPKETLVS